MQLTVLKWRYYNVRDGDSAIFVICLYQFKAFAQPRHTCDVLKLEQRVISMRKARTLELSAHAL